MTSLDSPGGGCLAPAAAGEAREEAEDDEEEDAVDDDLELEEFGLALFGVEQLLFPLAFFGSACCLRVDMSDSGMVMYCWAPSEGDTVEKNTVVR